MNFIKNVIEGKNDELTHKQFRRFGKGIFQRKAMAQVKNKKTSYEIKTTFEYLDGFLLFIAENYKGEVEITGTIQGASDLETKAKKFGLTGEKKSAMGVKKLKLNPFKLNASKLKDILEEFKDEFLLLSISFKGFSLISKEGLPKPGKKDKEEDDDSKDKIDFCKITIDADALGNNFVKELTFDVNKDFKTVIAKHDFVIDGFEIPKEYANDPAKARIYGLRLGKIIRELDVDGTVNKNEFKMKA